MKSLLVDALRQLEEEDKAPEATTPAPPADAAASDSGELELAPDTPAEPAPDAPVVEDAVDASGLALEPDDAVGVEASDEDVHPLTSTMALDVEGADRHLDVADAAPNTTFGSSTQALTAISADTPRLQRIAAFTPLLCLFLGSVSAGAYFAYTLAGAVHLNADLGSLPSHVRERIDESAPPMETRLFALAPEAARPPEQTLPEDLPVMAPTRGSQSMPTTPKETSSVRVAEISKSPEDLAYPLLEDAFGAWESGDVATAETLYRQALAVAPRHPNALLGLGAVLRATGRLDDATPVYESLLSLEPDNASAAAALLGDGGDVARIRGLLERHPESAPLHFALGSALASNGQWADARVSFSTAFELVPERADYAFNLAVSFDRVGRYLDAERMYGEALSLADTNESLDRDIVVARLNELSTMNAGNQK